MRRTVLQDAFLDLFRLDVIPTRGVEHHQVRCEPSALRHEGGPLVGAEMAIEVTREDAVEAAAAEGEGERVGSDERVPVSGA
jgi:hypothetical protein